MQEGRNGVLRLLRAIEQNIDDNNISVLAQLLNYHEPQLKQDIEAISISRNEFKITAEQQTAIIEDFASQAMEAPEVYTKAVGRTLINLGMNETEADMIEKMLFANIER